MKNIFIGRSSPHNIFSILILSALIFLSTVTLSFAKSSAFASAENYVSRVGTKVITAANQQSLTRFRALLHHHAAIRAIGLFSLGPFVRKLPTGSRPRYYQLVENWVARTLTNHADKLRGERFEIIGSKARGKREIIVTTKIIGGSGVPVKWRIRRTSRGYRIYDVNISGIWLSLLMKSTFINKLKESNGDFRAFFAYLQ